MYRGLSALIVTSLLAACGGGGGGGSGNTPPPPPAPSGLSYPAPPALTVNTAMTALTPAVTGSPTSYQVAPTLPAGLALSTTTGVISGTPTAPTASASYTVTASNTSGNTTATVSLQVKDIPPAITYPKATYRFMTGVPTTGTVPQASGGAVITWAVDHALPAGLALNATNGSITGSPIGVAAPATFVITATNSGGSDTFDLDIGVESGVMFDLGHTTNVDELKYDGSRIVSADGVHAVLWNATTAQKILRVDRNCVALTNFCRNFVALAGTVAVFRDEDSLQVRASNDGALLSDIPLPSTGNDYYWQLATDGGYIVAWSNLGLTAWSTNGTMLATRNGDYSTAQFLAAAGEVLIAKGPAGPNVIEHVAVPGGAATNSTFLGSFAAWFADSTRFLSNAGNTVMVYSASGTQLDISALPAATGLGGLGEWFWVQAANEWRIYRVGSSATPAVTYPLLLQPTIYASGQTLAALDAFGGSFIVVDVSGSSPSRTDYSAKSTHDASAFSALSNSQWVVANRRGAVIAQLTGDMSARTYSYGAARSIVSSSARIAVSTASDRLLLFGADRTFDTALPLEESSLRISSNGSRLAALANTDRGVEGAIRALSLPAGNILAEWTYPFSIGGTTPIQVGFDQSGSLIGRVEGTYDGSSYSWSRTVTDLAGGPVWSDSFTGTPSNWGNTYDEVRVNLAPTAHLIATSTGIAPASLGTNVYQNGLLDKAFLGWPVDWIDDSRLLVNRYSDGGTGGAHYMYCTVVDASGAVLKTLDMPEITHFQTVSSNEIYSPDRNEIIDLTTGQAVWGDATPNSPAAGAVAGDHVIFPLDNVIRAEPR